MDSTSSQRNGTDISNSPIPLPGSDVDPVGPPTPERHRGNVRFKWTLEMNSYLYRTYLRITKLESAKTPYGRALHREMTQKFPELANKTVMNIMCQRRELFTKNRLPPHLIQQIRNEVAVELGHRVVTTNAAENVEEGNQTHVIIPIEEQQADDTLETNIMKYQGLDPSLRMRIPRLRTTCKTKSILHQVNNALSRRIASCTDLTSLHDHVYSEAMSVVELHNQAVRNPERVRTTATPKWDTRLASKIERARREIGVLTQYINNEHPSTRVNRKAEEILQRYKDAGNPTPQAVLDLLKQRLQVYSTRLKRYRQAYKRRTDNMSFTRNQRSFYRNILNQPRAEGEGQFPDELRIKGFWGDIWEKERQHKHSAQWITLEKHRVERVETMLPYSITERDIKLALGKAANWRAPGPDGVHNYWFKRFTAIHNKLAVLLTETLQSPDSLPKFLTKGSTHLLPKSETPLPDPSKYRPITCLPTLYKIFTAILCEKIGQHMTNNGLLAEEQKGCRKASQGCEQKNN